MKRKKTPGSGRKKGSKNKLNRAAQLAKALAEAGMTPLEYMLYVMRDPKVRPERRDEMARAAAPYLHAKRAPENRDGHTVPPMIYTHPPHWKLSVRRVVNGVHSRSVLPIRGT